MTQREKVKVINNRDRKQGKRTNETHIKREGKDKKNQPLVPLTKLCEKIMSVDHDFERDS